MYTHVSVGEWGGCMSELLTKITFVLRETLFIYLSFGQFLLRKWMKISFLNAILQTNMLEKQKYLYYLCSPSDFVPSSWFYNEISHASFAHYCSFILSIYNPIWRANHMSKSRNIRTMEDKSTDAHLPYAKPPQTWGSVHETLFSTAGVRQLGVSWWIAELSHSARQDFT